MIEKLVQGFVIVAMVFMVMLAYAQNMRDACAGARSKHLSPAVQLTTTYRLYRQSRQPTHARSQPHHSPRLFPCAAVRGHRQDRIDEPEGCLAPRSLFLSRHAKNTASRL